MRILVAWRWSLPGESRRFSSLAEAGAGFLCTAAPAAGHSLYGRGFAGKRCGLPVAKALAVEVIGERSFEPIGESAFARAAARMKTCGKVLCCLREFGAMNGKNRELMELAKKAGTLTDSL